MAKDHPRTPEELAAMVDEAIRPLAASGDPIARQMLRCLTCDNVDARCSDCWTRAKRARESAPEPAGVSDPSPKSGTLY